MMERDMNEDTKMQRDMDGDAPFLCCTNTNLSMIGELLDAALAIAAVHLAICQARISASFTQPLLPFSDPLPSSMLIMAS